MSPLFRLTSMAQPFPAMRKPLCTNFFSIATPKRPLSSNFFWQPSSSRVLRSRQTRSYSGGFGPERQYAANMLLLKGLMGVNLAVWGYGIYTFAQARQGYRENYRRFMQNMTMNVTEFKNGYYWQAITAVFTHENFLHIGFNLLTFWYMGRTLAALPVTPGQFMSIVLGSGLTGSLGWLAQQEQKQKAGGYNIRQRGLGFSGAVLGTLTVVACFQPRSKVYIYGVLPLPLGLVALGYAVYDGYYLNSENTHTAHAGHLGGLAFGLAYYFLKLRNLRFPGSI